jgi:two-component system response regulator HupR/HoxA
MVLRETLLRHRWNKTHAAKELGLSRVGLRAKLQLWAGAAPGGGGGRRGPGRCVIHP